ncbi:CLUMA_CG009497, isoform A [Clunio marinus]|uniref:CLUMA_CG009497, isoform A n=1 Tax=Clunio marinus TaxID=568069 RepID=A0A1J1I924_9DIPT|nr:CLUMA_CG009497, isoform A [Clunio marinus]
MVEMRKPPNKSAGKIIFGNSRTCPNFRSKSNEMSMFTIIFIFKHPDLIQQFIHSGVNMQILTLP